MTCLRKFYDMKNENGTSIYTCDYWTIPETGTDIWCTAWKHGLPIKPSGDGCHVIVNMTTYHCDELLQILMRLENEGYRWGLDGVSMIRRQLINNNWKIVTNEFDKTDESTL